LALGLKGTEKQVYSIEGGSATKLPGQASQNIFRFVLAKTLDTPDDLVFDLNLQPRERWETSLQVAFTCHGALLEPGQALRRGRTRRQVDRGFDARRDRNRQRVVVAIGHRIRLS
jgi:hypothetical protein